MQPPASQEQIRQLGDALLDQLAVALPPAYASFLALHNGLDWNGFCIYAAEKTPIAGYDDRFIYGCLDVNLVRRELAEWNRYLIVASFGDDEYCLHPPTKRYVVVDAVAFEEFESFDSFGGLIAHGLRTALS